jgi:DNA-binding MarR family transcriptional regulator
MAAAPDDQQVIQQVMRASALAQDLRALLGKLKRRLREQAHVGDLTPSQVSVLLRLEKDGPATASNLARAEGMRPQSMAPVIAALEGAGLVSGAPDPADGRQTFLSLTAACRKWVEEGRAARQDWLIRTLQARLSLQEQDELAKAVELLKRLADD